ncbi:MAG: YgiQ family radical SAM protein [Oscillospiraceae bacterium]|nr:YgiQ family radical SAM protein [Oscillospiraceae bacterium]
MFLPISKLDMQARGIERLDFIFVTGDAYVDHPAWACAIIPRVLEANGFTVGIISQPDFRTCDDFTRLGKPRLGFLVSAGNLDSMVANYTASKKVRSDDPYSPKTTTTNASARMGIAGSADPRDKLHSDQGEPFIKRSDDPYLSGNTSNRRPDRTTIIYCNRIREAYGRNMPIIIGGIEASLRRFAHYDYISDKVRRGILIDSTADLLVFGMGERAIVEIARALETEKVANIKNIAGTAYVQDANDELPANAVIVPSFDEVSTDKAAYAEAFRLQYLEQDPIHGKPVAQPHGVKTIVQNPPAMPLSTKELDFTYSLPYERTYHPMYEEFGGVAALNEVEFSVVSSRGCFGGCNFCALTFHQGRIVTARSHKSILNEAKNFTYNPDFKGYIHDVGGPTANFRAPACGKQLESGSCRERQCLHPAPCGNLEVSHKDYLNLLTELREIDGVKKVFVRSGLRYDYIMADSSDKFLTELAKHHISGQLKVAPEHVSDKVLRYMGKPRHSVYEKFRKKYEQINSELGKKQFLVPYLISSHPVSTLADAIALAEYLRDIRYQPQQVQDFYPTPGTLSTCMYYTGLDPLTMEKVYVPKSYKERQMQRALLQYRNPKNYQLVYDALTQAKRFDLIGFDKHCLIRPPNRLLRGGNYQKRRKLK